MAGPKNLQPFTKAKHFQEYFMNSIGRVIPVRFTILSKINEDGNSVDYSVAWCATDEKQFRKKEGVAVAKTKPVFTVELDDVPDKHANYNINDAILVDLYENHYDEIPYSHRKFFDMLHKEF